MNRRSDIDRVLQVWMDDGPTAIPDRVVDVVAARIGVQRQRRAWPFQRRTNVTPIKLIAGLAAALVVAVLGYSLLPKNSSFGGQTPVPSPTATPAPTVAVSAAPSGGVACPAWLTTGCSGTAGILSSGSHTTRSFAPAFTYTVPDGWVNNGDSRDIFALFPDTPSNQAEFARSGALAQSILMGPHASPYFVCDAAEDNSGGTAAEMVAAIVANEALATSGLVDVTIGGLTGKQFDVQLNPDWTGTCPPSPDDPGDLGDGRTRAFLLDAPGRGVIVIFVGSLHPAGHEAFVAEAMPIIESFQFEQ